LLNNHVDPACEESSVFDLEYRREVFHWAAERARDQVIPTTWQAFWMTSIEQRSIADVSEELAMSVGAVHIARSRVLGRLPRLVQEFEQRNES
jgi:RNA polymerase sigma-70 factor (ECF subfamily)